MPSFQPFKIEVTPEYERAMNILKMGCPVVFITGKAGTGKSTFIDYFRSTVLKRIAVVAPTGTAALNVGGQTIHSFFRFPPRIMDKHEIERVYNAILYEKLEVLIIDEASMLRVDLLDNIDQFLRLNSLEPKKPFGGVQIVLVGDLFQLPPVVPKDEMEILESKGYDTPYFLSAKCLRSSDMQFIELTKIYRQENRHFIELLNNVREGFEPEETVREINAQCYSPFHSDADSDITLTCTNAKATAINTRRLRQLDGREHTYQGKIKGNFNINTDKLPSPIELKLKAGAQVMFTRNDSKLRWANGSIGTVTRLDEERIWVEADGDVHEIEPVKWETVQYTYDKISDNIIADVNGEFKQYPLILAYAITIHKSQGKTLRNICIDLGGGAFAYGQTYVALSRCPTIRDITLKKPLTVNDIKVDEQILGIHDELRERMV